MNADPHPSISHNGYELCSVSEFLSRAPEEYIARYLRDCAGNGEFIIWDPNDDADGFMLCLPSVAELNAEFLSYFEGFLEGPAQ